MADVSHVITLGLGTPADIPHFLLMGLSINLVAAVDVSADFSVTAVAQDVIVRIPADDCVIRVRPDDGSITS